MEAITIYVKAIKTGNPVANLVLRVISEEYEDNLGYVGTLDGLAQASECERKKLKKALLLLEKQNIIVATQLDSVRYRINFPRYDQWKRDAAFNASRRCA